MSQSIVYGVHALEALLSSQPQSIDVVYVGQENKNPRVASLMDMAKENSIPVEFVKTQTLVKLADSEQHQNIAAKIREQHFTEQDLYQWIKTTEKVPLILVLEDMQDPHNLGACIRSAVAFGADWVVVPKANSAPFNALVTKISCGASLKIKKLAVGNLVRVLNEIKKYDIWVVGLDMAGSTPFKEAKLKRPLAVVMGHEGHGLKQLTVKHCDELARIDMPGVMESLNVSVTAGICLYEAAQHRQ